MTLFAFFFFVLGLVIGSFLNVVIYRINTDRSLGGRSACMSCRSRLHWYELIPLFSFLGLGGRCRSCRTRISLIYPVVEALTGFIFLALFLKFQPIFLSSLPMFVFIYAYYALMFSILMVIAVYDFRHKIIPDSLSLVFGLIAFFSLFLLSTNTGGFPVLGWHLPSVLELFSGVFMALPFAFFWLVSGGAWMGLGDAKLALGLGWFLGLSSALSALVVAFWSGAIVGICLIIFSKKYGMKSEIPFALYLVLGAFTAFICEFNFFPYV